MTVTSKHAGAGALGAVLLEQEVAEPVVDDRVAEAAAALEAVGVAADDEVGAGVDERRGQRLLVAASGTSSFSMPQWRNTTTVSLVARAASHLRHEPVDPLGRRHAGLVGAWRSTPRSGCSSSTWVAAITAIRWPSHLGA